MNSGRRGRQSRKRFVPARALAYHSRFPISEWLRAWPMTPAAAVEQAMAQVEAARVRGQNVSF